ncbi:hypothetical protein ACPA9J_01690 [Pseudomonas aeruginosa]
MLRDGCVDGDAELHDYLMARVISDHADHRNR